MFANTAQMWKWKPCTYLYVHARSSSAFFHHPLFIMSLSLALFTTTAISLIILSLPPPRSHILPFILSV
uniref:Ovule protein n=1 Tax=Hydatigena taeniaeformis TaxID=6205 RepID=A0A0R3WKD2_HYDTA